MSSPAFTHRMIQIRAGLDSKQKLHRCLMEYFLNIPFSQQKYVIERKSSQAHTGVPSKNHCSIARLFDTLQKIFVYKFNLFLWFIF